MKDKDAVEKEIKTLEDKIDNRARLRCKGRDCDMRKGFFCWAEQKDLMLKKKCLLCGKGIVDIFSVPDLVEQDPDLPPPIPEHLM